MVNCKNKMKSKSFETRPCSADKKKAANSYDFLNVNKSFDFVGLYKTAAETEQILEKHKSEENVKDTTKSKVETPKRERSVYKNKKKSKQESLDISQINIDGSSLNSGTGASAGPNSKATSTPNVKNQGSQVKSIMKNNSVVEQSQDSPRPNVSNGKPKKRNKSVSFMLDDNEEVVIKKTKSEENIKSKKLEAPKATVKDKKKPFKKQKKDQQSEKENKATNQNDNMDVESTPVSNQNNKHKLLKDKKTEEPSVSTGNETEVQEKKKKLNKRNKKHKPETAAERKDSESSEVTSEPKVKKQKKKKQKVTDKPDTDGEGEPVPKSRKKDPKPDITEDLENLSIGDNAHTLTNLLDEMTVVDKDKRKKLKLKGNKNKRPKGPNKEEDTEKSEEVKEKVKWKNRKWNKDKKGDLNESVLATTVLVENLPLAIMLNYKKLLSEHFAKCGLIKKIGIAEVYPTEESKPVFTTTINFYSDGAADQALEFNNTEFEGSRIRVKRPLPPTATTIVVRSYAEITDQNISSLFLGAGKIRSIKHLVKGKKTTATAFVEFDGPESVEAALKMAVDAKIGGKKIHVAKFEPRQKKKKENKSQSDGDSAAEADSEDANE